MNESAVLSDVLSRWALSRLGFDPRTLRIERLLVAAQIQVRRLGSAEALERALALRDSRTEDPLVEAATVGETYFFRQHEHFDLLATLPQPKAKFRAWSAGCATGEEAYSLAAALRSQFQLDAESLEVWGTDFNAKALGTAQAAVYGRWSWRVSMGPAWQRLQDSALDPATRACVRFAQHNLLDPADFDGQGGERFDLVFCRNVLVYFSAEAAQAAVARIAEAMKPGAWLVLGNMDLGGPPRA